MADLGNITDLKASYATRVNDNTSNAVTPADVRGSLDDTADTLNGLLLTPGFNNQSGTTYSTQASDVGRTIWCTNSGAVTVTINHANVRVVQAGTGQVSLAAGSGITLVMPVPLVTARTYGQYSILEVLPTPTATTFLVCGQLEA